MKATQVIWKIIAAVLVVGAVVGCVIVFWDKIEAAVCSLKAKLCKAGLCSCECEDYADWNVE